MKKSEKIISAIVAMVLGILFIILKDNFIGILMTIAGLTLIVFGVVDIISREVPLAIVKLVAGLVLIIAGWALVEAVLYILAGILLVVGTLLLYDKIKNRVWCNSIWLNTLHYATPVLCILIGGLLLFQGESVKDIICVLVGILTILEGGVLLFNALMEE